jgi:hypothetical protein
MMDEIAEMFDGPSRSAEDQQDRLEEGLLTPFNTASDGMVTQAAINKLLKKSGAVVEKQTSFKNNSVDESSGSRIREGLHNGKEGFWVFVEADAVSQAALDLIDSSKASTQDPGKKKQLDAQKKAIDQGLDPAAVMGMAKVTDSRAWNFRDVLNESLEWKGLDNELDIEDSKSEENEDLDDMMDTQEDDYAEYGANNPVRNRKDRGEHELLPDGSGAIHSNKKEERAETFLKAYRSFGENIFSKNEISFIFKNVNESYNNRIPFKTHCLRELKPLIEVM